MKKNPMTPRRKMARMSNRTLKSLFTPSWTFTLHHPSLLMMTSICRPPISGLNSFCRTGLGWHTTRRGMRFMHSASARNIFVAMTMHRGAGNPIIAGFRKLRGWVRSRVLVLLWATSWRGCWMRITTRRHRFMNHSVTSLSTNGKQGGITWRDFPAHRSSCIAKVKEVA